MSIEETRQAGQKQGASSRHNLIVAKHYEEMGPKGVLNSWILIILLIIEEWTENVKSVISS